MDALESMKEKSLVPKRSDDGKQSALVSSQGFKHSEFTCITDRLHTGTGLILEPTSGRSSRLVRESRGSELEEIRVQRHSAFQGKNGRRQGRSVVSGREMSGDLGSLIQG